MLPLATVVYVEARRPVMKDNNRQYAGILKVLPKEAACLLPSNSTKERNLGKMFRPSAAVVCVLLPTAGCVPAC